LSGGLEVNLRSTFLSLALAGGCVWCILTVQQVRSEEKAASQPAENAFAPIAPLPALVAAQERELAEAKEVLKKENYKLLERHANVLAELFIVKQYQKEVDRKSAAEGKDRSTELIAAAKAKDAKKAEELIGQVEALIKKPASDAKANADKLPPFKPVSDVLPLMKSQQYHFDEIKKLLGDKEPDIKKIENHGYALAELCNVNFYQKDKDDYKKWATEAKDLSVALAKAAADKKTDDAQKALRDIHTKCGECHDKYQ
jgi:cytochrome c553